jgi:hypothetical protein
MFDIILTSNTLTTVASVITISYFTKDILKYIISLIRTYVTKLKNELVNQIKSLISEALNDKLKINAPINNNDNNNDNDSIHEFFEDLPLPKKVDIVEPLTGLKKKAGDSIHSQQASASLFPEKLNNAKFIGTTGEYYETPMEFGKKNDFNQQIPIFTRFNDPESFENLEKKMFDRQNQYKSPTRNIDNEINFALDGSDTRYKPKINFSLNNQDNLPQMNFNQSFLNQVEQNILSKPATDNNILTEANPLQIPIYTPIHVQKLNNKTIGLLKKKNNFLNDNLQQHIDVSFNINKNDASLNKLDTNLNLEVSPWMMSSIEPDINGTTKLPIHDLRGEIKSI